MNLTSGHSIMNLNISYLTTNRLPILVQRNNIFLQFDI